MRSRFLPTTVLAASLCLAVHPGQGALGGTGTLECVWTMGVNTLDAFTRSTVGDFDGDGLNDLVCLRGGELEIVGSPGLFGWWVDQLGPARDVDVLPAEALGDADGLLSVGTGGLELRTELGHVDPGSGALAPTVTQLAGGAWIGARRVAVARVGEEPAPRIVGCMADRRTVRTLRHDGSDYQDELVPLDPPLAQNAKEVCLVDYEGDDVPELTVMTASTVHIFSLSTGSQIISFPLPSGWKYDALAIGSQAAEGSEWIALIVTHPGGVKQYLTTIDFTGMAPGVYVDGDPGVVAMDSGDFDLDGDSELLLSSDGVGQLWLLTNEPDPQSPIPAPLWTLSGQGLKTIPYPTGPGGAQGNKAFPALCDVDADGDLDLMLPVRSNSTLFVRWNGTVAEQDYKPLVTPTFPINGVPTPSIRELALDLLELKATLSTPTIVPPEATHLELAVLRKDDIASETQPVAVWSTRLPWPPSSSDALIELPDPDYSFTPPFEELGQEVLFENFYIWHQRLIRVQGGSRVRVWPASLYGIETSIGTANREYMESLLVEGAQMKVYYDCGTCSTVNPDEVGTVTPLPCLPTPPRAPVVIP